MMSSLLRWVDSEDDDGEDSDWTPEYDGESASLTFEDDDGSPVLSPDERAKLDKVFDGEAYAPRAPSAV